ncbi:hypothetical protein PHMEG_00035684, partial [Phytophthora megakarya]
MARSYGTETVDFAREQDAFIDRRNGSRRHRYPWVAIVLSAVVGLAGFVYMASMHKSLSTQHDIIVKMQQQLDAMHAATTVEEDTTWDSKKKFKKAKKFPTKFAVDYVTPLKTQDERGTCWDFATVGVLENSYRQQGVAHGWLHDDEYMAISEQAYGAE